MKHHSTEKLSPICKVAGTIWEEDKNSILYVRLNKYYQNDVLIWAEYPVEEISALFKKTLKYKEVCLNGLAPALKEQVKAYIRNELNRLDKKYAIILYNCIRPLTNVIPYMEKLRKKIFYVIQMLNCMIHT